MARFAFILAAGAAALFFVLHTGASVGAMVDRIAYRQACIISSAQLDEPVTACGRIR